jgi:hypothetical protein
MKYKLGQTTLRLRQFREEEFVGKVSFHKTTLACGNAAGTGSKLRGRKLTPLTGLPWVPLRYPQSQTVFNSTENCYHVYIRGFPAVLRSREARTIKNPMIIFCRLLTNSTA